MNKRPNCICTTCPPSLHRRGSVVVLALIFLTLFATLAVSFAAATNMNLQQARNYHDASEAFLAAESGLQFARYHLAGLLVEDEEDPNMLALTADTLASRLHGSVNLGNRSVTINGDIVAVPCIDLGDQRSFGFTLHQVDASTIRLTVTGKARAARKRIAVDYTVTEDKSILSYAVASTLRMIITGSSEIHGDVYSSWTRTDISGVEIPPFLLEPQSTVHGELKTTLSEADYLVDDCGEYVEGTHGGESYEEPPMQQYTVDDFDTSAYRARAVNNLPEPDRELTSSWYPGEFKQTRLIENRPVYENRTFEDLRIPKGVNPVFINCTFRKITYVETNETVTLDQWTYSRSTQNSRFHSDPGNLESNNVVFRDCRFEGSIVTGVPREFWWTKNCLSFEGNTTFDNQYMPESTILAPNFNINIGDFNDGNSNSKVTGILVGGIVDIRDNAVIEGTILTMADLKDNLGSGLQYYGTNVGYYEDDAEGGAPRTTSHIVIRPQENNPLPFGMKYKYALKIVPDSYLEVH